MQQETLNALVEPYRPLLSSHENEVLDCILSGWNAREIADELSVKQCTLNKCIHDIRRAIRIPRYQHFRVWLRSQANA